MENRKDVTVSLPQEWVEHIDDNLSYGDSRSAWIREAVRQRLESEGVGTGNMRQTTVVEG